jgi:hypothetical protein
VISFKEIGLLCLCHLFCCELDWMLFLFEGIMSGLICIWYKGGYFYCYFWVYYSKKVKKDVGVRVYSWMFITESFLHKVFLWWEFKLNLIILKNLKLKTLKIQILINYKNNTDSIQSSPQYVYENLLIIPSYLFLPLFFYFYL